MSNAVRGKARFPHPATFPNSYGSIVEVSLAVPVAGDQLWKTNKTEGACAKDKPCAQITLFWKQDLGRSAVDSATVVLAGVSRRWSY